MKPYVCRLICLVVALLPAKAASETITVIDLSAKWEKAPQYNDNVGYCKVQEALHPFSLWGYVVVQHGKLVAEGYTPGAFPNGKCDTWSTTKSWVSMVVGKLVELGELSLTDTLGEMFLDSCVWQGVEQATEIQSITLEELLTMTSGLFESGLNLQLCANDALKMLSYNATMRGRYQYLASSHILAFAIFERTGMSLEEIVYEYDIFPRMGISRFDFHWWRIFSGGLEGSAYGFRTNPRTMAKLGQLYLQDGLSAPRELLIPQDWVRMSTTNQLARDDRSHVPWLIGYGLQWYAPGFNDTLVNDNPNLEDMAVAHGANGMHIIVLPKVDMVMTLIGRVVTNGEELRLIQTVFDNLDNFGVSLNHDQRQCRWTCANSAIGSIWEGFWSWLG